MPLDMTPAYRMDQKARRRDGRAGVSKINMKTVDRRASTKNSRQVRRIPFIKGAYLLIARIWKAKSNADRRTRESPFSR